MRLHPLLASGERSASRAAGNLPKYTASPLYPDESTVAAISPTSGPTYNSKRSQSMCLKPMMGAEFSDPPPL